MIDIIPVIPSHSPKVGGESCRMKCECGPSQVVQWVDPEEVSILMSMYQDTRKEKRIICWVEVFEGQVTLSLTKDGETSVGISNTIP